jgi:hypothetical protein
MRFVQFVSIVSDFSSMNELLDFLTYQLFFCRNMVSDFYV